MMAGVTVATQIAAATPTHVKGKVSAAIVQAPMNPNILGIIFFG